MSASLCHQVTECLHPGITRPGDCMSAPLCHQVTECLHLCHQVDECLHPRVTRSSETENNYFYYLLSWANLPTHKKPMNMISQKFKHSIRNAPHHHRVTTEFFF